jgi:nucleoid-associated protein YgaU
MKLVRRLPIALICATMFSCTTTPDSGEEMGEELVVDEQQADISADALGSDSLATPDASEPSSEASDPAENLSEQESATSSTSETEDLPSESQADSPTNTEVADSQPEATQVQQEVAQDEPSVVTSSDDSQIASAASDSNGAVVTEQVSEVSPVEANETISTAEAEESNSEIEPVAASSQNSFAGESGSYIVRPGDTLSKIATKLYGTASAANKLAKINSLEDPNLIFPGDVLKTDPSGFQTTATSKDETREITVEAGDTLSKIAEKVFGDPGTWKYIWKLNEATLPDPNRIEPGVKLSVVISASSTGAEESH